MVSLQAFVLAAALAGSGDLVLLDFGASWCAPCRSMEPTIARLEQAGYPVRRVDVEAQPDLAKRFGIGPIPCFVLVRDGREVQRIVGGTSYEQLVQLFRHAEPAAIANNGIRGQSPDPLPPSPMAAGPLSFGQGGTGMHGNLPAHSGPPIRPVSSHTGGHLQDSAGRVMPPPTAATTPLAEHQLGPAHRLALQATVRLRVTDATGQSKGTGTIIDVHGDEALVVTCGHIFRESKGRGEIMVDLFAPGSRGPVPGHLLLYEADQRDFGLVSIRLNTSVTPAKVATSSYLPRKGEPIFSVGCNHGDHPTVRASTISAIDRYVGHPNIEIHGHPVDGRSGGGLFTTSGQIIGICNAADLQEDRGIYAALPTIHLALDKIGQTDIYSAPMPPITLAGDRTPPGPPAAMSPQPMPRTIGHSIPPTATAGARSLREVICIVRAPDGTTRVIVVPDPSNELLQQMYAESQQQPLPAPRRATPPNDLGIARMADRSLPGSPPVVRAQSRQ